MRPTPATPWSPCAPSSRRPLPVNLSTEGFFDNGLTFTTSAPLTIESALLRIDSTSAIVALIAGGPLAVALVVLALTSRMLALRRRPSIMLAAARGASVKQLGVLLAIEGLVIGLVGAVGGAMRRTRGRRGSRHRRRGGPGAHRAHARRACCRFSGCWSRDAGCAPTWGGIPHRRALAAGGRARDDRAGRGRGGSRAERSPVVGRRGRPAADASCRCCWPGSAASSRCGSCRWCSPSSSAASRRGGDCSRWSGRRGRVVIPRSGSRRCWPSSSAWRSRCSRSRSSRRFRMASRSRRAVPSAPTCASRRPTSATDQLDDLAAIDGVAHSAPVYADEQRDAELPNGGFRVTVYVIDVAELRAVQTDPATAIPLPDGLTADIGDDDPVPVIASERLAEQRRGRAAGDRAARTVDILGFRADDDAARLGEQLGRRRPPARRPPGHHRRSRRRSSCSISTAGADTDAVAKTALEDRRGDVVDGDDPGDDRRAAALRPGAHRGARRPRRVGRRGRPAARARDRHDPGARRSRARPPARAARRTRFPPQRASCRSCSGRWRPPSPSRSPSASAIGLLLPWIVIPAIDLTGFVGGATQPVVHLGGWAPALVAAGFLVVTALAVLVAALVARRVTAARTLRSIDEEG